MDIIIFAGQSNMQGQSECLSENTVVNNAYEYLMLSDELVLLKNPVGEDITYSLERGYCVTPETNISEWLKAHVLGAACYGNTNLVPSFCRTYTSITNKAVIAVHAAKGSTEISQWMPDGQIYPAMLQKAKGAIRKVDPERIFFVWLQGESDAIFGHGKAYYKKALRELNAALKRDLGIDRFGIIRVGYFANDARDLEIISAQDEVCAEDEDFVMLTEITTELNQQAEYMHPSIPGHFSSKGLEKLGKEAAKELANLA